MIWSLFVNDFVSSYPFIIDWTIDFDLKIVYMNIIVFDMEE
jgi:hypothetical protein